MLSLAGLLTRSLDKARMHNDNIVCCRVLYNSIIKAAISVVSSCFNY